MERARVVLDARIPVDTVRMGSRVQYTTNDDELNDVTLVYPSDADIPAGRISVRTLVGAALSGLCFGQRITWRARDGKKHVLTILGVDQLEAVA